MTMTLMIDIDKNPITIPASVFQALGFDPSYPAVDPQFILQET